MRMYVGNLSYQAGAIQLRELFAAFGEVTDATIITDKDTGQSKGFGFVEMRVRADAENAMEVLDGSTYEGRQLKVNLAKERDRSPRAREDHRADRRDKSPRGW